MSGDSPKNVLFVYYLSFKCCFSPKSNLTILSYFLITVFKIEHFDQIFNHKFISSTTIFCELLKVPPMDAKIKCKLSISYTVFDHIQFIYIYIYIYFIFACYHNMMTIFNNLIIDFLMIISLLMIIFMNLVIDLLIICIYLIIALLMIIFIYLI